MDIINDIIIKIAVQEFCVFLDVLPAPLLIDSKNGVYYLPDHGRARAFSPATFVIADHRRGDIEVLGKDSLGDVKGHPPLF